MMSSELPFIFPFFFVGTVVGYQMQNVVVGKICFRIRFVRIVFENAALYWLCQVVPHVQSILLVLRSGMKCCV